MKIGMIGLGRMGANMVRKLTHSGHQCVVFDQNPSAVKTMTIEGALGLGSLDGFKTNLEKPRAVWMMLPAGMPTENTVQALSNILDAGDFLIDGGNSYFKDSVRRYTDLKKKGIRYVDVGVSGGLWGLTRGYCLMIGGDKESTPFLNAVFAALAKNSQQGESDPSIPSHSEGGYLYCGPSGSGHFVKMIHNGIEYGMMQSLAEGFDLLRGARNTKLPQEYQYDLNLAEVAEVWRKGSVISSWLLDLLAHSLAQDAELSEFTGRVEDSGEGRWTVNTALEEEVPAEVLTSALYIRYRSRMNGIYGDKVLSALRKEFGGHQESSPMRGTRPASKIER